MSLLLLLFLTSLLIHLKRTYSSPAESCPTLYLLHVVPLEATSDNDWERGLEIAPAGHLAAQQINNNPKILNGSTLEIIDVQSGLCGSTSSLESFVDVMRLSTSQQRCVFGVVGLYCLSITKPVAEALNNPRFGYVQLSSATSHLLQNTTTFPYLFRVEASNEIYGDATIEMMRHLNWTRISVVYNFTDITARRTGQTFSDLVDSLTAIALTEKTTEEIDYIFSELSKATSRILFLSVSSEEGGIILCEAYKRKLRWPFYAYIFAHQTLEDILAYNGSCSHSVMKRAVEGAFFLYKRRSVTSETVLVSGQTFGKYKEDYWRALRQAVANIGNGLQENEYANTLYDQVWAFALAMNFSLSDVHTAINKSFIDVVPMLVENREALWKGLHHVSFQGASGMITFNNRQEVPTAIDIIQAQNGNMVFIGEFVKGELEFYANFNVHSVPPDFFDSVDYSIPLALSGIIIIVQTFLLVLVLTSTIAMTYWRERAEVKSTSIQISYLMLVGAFLLCISPLLYTLIDVLHIPHQVYSAICNVELWIFFLGVNIIVVCLLFRLVRIVYVFRSYRSTGKYCSDMYLLLYIFLTCSIMVFILIVWDALDPLQQASEKEPQPTANPPHFLLFRYCKSNWLGVWLGISYTWVTLLLVIIVGLAILTRKIKRENFKDTKKVNVFAFSIFITCAIFLPLSRLLEPMHYFLVSFILRNTSHIIIILLSQILLFLPKYIPILLGRPTKTDRTRTTMRTMRTIRTLRQQQVHMFY